MSESHRMPRRCHIEGTTYELWAPIGRGGMAEVFSGLEESSRDLAAVKVLRPELVEAREIRGFFLAEAELLRRLDHPCLPRFFGVGRTFDGRPCFAMEHCGRRSLAEAVDKNGPLSARATAIVGLGICDALDYLHRENLRHGDLKPANVLCRGNSVVVADLGLAQGLMDERRTVVYGTAHYLAPEVIRGEASGAAADVYALGALLYFCLTGDTVFSGNTAVEVCARHLYDEPLTPSLRCAEPVPAALDAIILAALAKQPFERPSVANLVRALEVVRATEAPPCPSRRLARGSVVQRLASLGDFSDTERDVVVPGAAVSF